MSKISANNFARDIPSKSSNSFANSDPTVSTNTFTKDAFTPGGYAWEGENLAGGAGIGDMISGIAPGIGEAGGISHFLIRAAPPDISHG